jgi:hypothetical protein
MYNEAFAISIIWFSQLAYIYFPSLQPAGEVQLNAHGTVPNAG